MTLRLVILDRDGVLNVDRADYVKTVAELVMIPGAGAAVGRLTAARLRVAVATNQACVAKGLVGLSGLDEIHALLLDRVAAAGGIIDRIYVAPEARGAPDGRRKPSPAMLLEAMRDLEAAPAETVFIGDATTDREAAQAAGIRFLLVRTGHGRQSEAVLGLPASEVFDDLPAAVEALLA